MAQPIHIPLDLETLAICQDDAGTVSYGLALAVSSAYGLADSFSDAYGLPGDWEDVETGAPLGLDAGELTVWIQETAAA